MKISSYPDIKTLGHPATIPLFTGPVLVEEKVDGSQLSMGRQEDGSFIARSRGKELVKGAVENLFQKAYDHGEGLDLRPGWVYRGECVSRLKHNSLTYERCPAGFFVIFDIEDDKGQWLSPAAKKKEADRIGLEVVPCFFEGTISPEMVKGFLGRKSFLGGADIEGVVVKPLAYDLYGRDAKVVMGKYVSEAFKEVHRSSWKVDNPRSGDILEKLVEGVRTEARWRKAVYRLRDAGSLLLEDKDIGPLIKEVQADLLKEEEEQIKETLWKWARQHVLRGATRGLPEWYKESLLKGEFTL